jgi:hypothetical protein
VKAERAAAKAIASSTLALGSAPEILLDLHDSEGTALGQGGLDPGAASLHEISPAFFAVGVALRSIRPPGRDLEEAGMGLHQLDPPILHAARHYWTSPQTPPASRN